MAANNVVLALLVENNANVLSRVSMLFGRRGYNIDSLTVSATDDPAVSRITLSTHGDDDVIDQIIKQTKKLVEVKAVQIETEDKAIMRELLLVKIAANEGARTAIRDICSIYKASIVDFSQSSVVCEVTGKPSKIDGFLDVVSQYEVLELCRTGVTAIDRGNKVMTHSDDSLHRC